MTGKFKMCQYGFHQTQTHVMQINMYANEDKSTKPDAYVLHNYNK